MVVRNLTFILAIVIAVAITHYFSMKVGISQQLERDLSLLMPMAEMQEECLDKEDISCLRFQNRLLLSFVSKISDKLSVDGIGVSELTKMDIQGFREAHEDTSFNQ